MKEFKRDVPISASLDERLSSSEVPYVFARNLNKSKVYNAPLLVIGLGGSGYDALSRAKEKLLECFVSDENGKMEGIEFLQIDTDDRDMKRCLESKNQYCLRRDEFKIFQNADIGAILRNREKNSDVLPEEIDEWLDKKIPIAQIVHGAAGIRQAGRLLLHLNIIEVIDAIKQKLEKIHEDIKLSKNPVNVVIFTGIGGGTGSGTFVDIAYIVRKCIEEFSGQAFITGVLLMPDILASQPEIDKITRENIKRNGFAALKELDHLMSLNETKDKFSQKYPGGFEITETDAAIFERCILISSMAEGRLLLPNAKEHAYNVAAEMVVDMVRNSTTVSNGSNDVSRKESALTGMQKPKAVNYAYTAVGGKSVYVDFNLVLNLFLEKVMEKEITLFEDAEVIKKDIDKIWDEMKIDDELQKLQAYKEQNYSGASGVYIQGKVTETAIFDNPKVYIDYELEYSRSAENEYKQEKDREFIMITQPIVEVCKELYLKIQNQYKLDVYERHLFAARNKLLDMLGTMKDYDISNDVKSAEKLQNKIRRKAVALYNERKDKKNKPKKISHKAIRLGRKIKNAATGAKDPLNLKECFDDLNKEAEKRMTIVSYNETIDKLEKEIRDIFLLAEDSRLLHEEEKMKQRYKELRAYWHSRLEKKYNLSSDDSTVKEINNVWSRGDSLFGADSIIPIFREVDVNKFVESIRDIINECYKEQVDSAALEFFCSMMDKTLRNLWLEKTDVSVDVQTGKILEKVLVSQKLCLDTLLHYVKEVKTPEVKAAWIEVMEAISTQSGVLFSKKAMRDGEVLVKPSYSEISIPRDNPILAAACKEVTGKEAVESDISNRISCMKYEQCQKLDDYVFIDELERVYNQSNSKCGLHLFENEKIHWEELPSPVYRNERADEYMSIKYPDAKNAIHYRNVFDTAVENKIIVYDKNQCYIAQGTLADGLPEENIPISTMEFQGTDIESEEAEKYKAYCRDWFTRMFYYREKVAEVCGMSLKIENTNDGGEVNE